MSAMNCGCDPEASHECDSCTITRLREALKTIIDLGMAIADDEPVNLLPMEIVRIAQGALRDP